MSSFRMRGQLTNSRTITAAIYANQIDNRATDADDKEVLFYNNGSPTSSANLTFDQSTNELTVNGTLNGTAGIIQDLTASNLSVSSLFSLPASIVGSFNPLAVAGTNFTAVAGGATGYSVNLGGLKMAWGEAEFTRATTGTPGVFSINNFGGDVFTTTPNVSLTIGGVGTDITQSLALNQAIANALNFWLNDNDNTVLGTSFIATWFAIGR